MKNLKKSLIVSALLAGLSANSFANEQPNATDLVDRFNIGVHGTFNILDNDRSAAPSIDFNTGKGLGLELGYRASESTEIRLAYTELDFDFKGSSVDFDGDILAIDALYFPTQKSFYVLAGLSKYDTEINTSEVSANAGLGYRHFHTERLATYAEYKAHYQFDNEFIDQTAQFGLVYFFGEKPTSAKPAKTKAPIATPFKPTEPKKPVSNITKVKDSDNDGVIDSKDNCKATPASNKVDANGCTIFTEETLSQRLLVKFGNNKTTIEAKDVPEVAKIAMFLKQYPQTNMVIEGHSSAQGNAAYNLQLSQKRADAVVALLVNKFDIDANRLTAKGYGEERLLNTANTAAAHKENRRIEANVSVTKKVSIER